MPAIIEYCNSLAYGGRVLPLRNSISEQLQPWVTYRVDGKYTGRKENVQEAEAVVDLIQSCIQEPEYEGKTFGIIILRSSDPMKKLVDRLLSKSLGKEVIDERKIICGNSEDFQGDERDVVFLLFLNSAEETALLDKLGSGHNEENIKRYNVAVSRAKDQVWLIHSFCPRSSLKPGDLRNDLFKHAQNPYANENKMKQVAELSESDFEQRVAKDLIYRKYCVQQQFPVGSYRLDMVIRYKDKIIALECDGDRYHSRPEQIQRDEEREEILSRAGWKLIRVRGGEYYRDPEGTINHICEQLTNFGTEPCEDLIDPDFTEYKETHLTLKVKHRADQLRQQRNESKFT